MILKHSFEEIDRNSVLMMEFLSYIKSKGYEPTTCSKKLLKIYLTLKERENMAKSKNYVLKENTVIMVGGIAYTNENLTDKVAKAFLKVNKKREACFTVISKAETKAETKEETKK